MPFVITSSKSSLDHNDIVSQTVDKQLHRGGVLRKTNGQVSNSGPQFQKICPLLQFNKNPSRPRHSRFRDYTQYTAFQLTVRPTAKEE